MWNRIVGVVLLGGVGFVGYDYYTSPYYDAPELEEGDFLLAISGEDGMRALMRGIADERTSRRYFAHNSSDVKPWFFETWSICRKPLEDETAAFERSVDLGPGGRLDALCKIDADGEVFVRGWVTSVPDL